MGGFQRAKEREAMVVASSESSPYLTVISNGTVVSRADTTRDKGGHESGFRPHELLEAAFAACMNIHLRMYSDNHGLRLESVRTTASLDRSEPPKAVFKYSIELTGELTNDQRNKLLQIAETCPVHNTLLREIGFQYR